MFKKFPDDIMFEEMDPIMRAWMFHNWIEDYNDEHKQLENQGYLIGSFSNPEAVRKALGIGADIHTSSDKEFDELSMRIREEGKEKDKKLKKRKRKLKGE